MDVSLPEFQASQLCDSCQHIFYNDDIADGLVHSESITSIVESAAAGCCFCALLEQMCASFEDVATDQKLTFHLCDTKDRRYRLSGKIRDHPFDFALVPFKEAKYFFYTPGRPDSYFDTKDTNACDVSGRLAYHWFMMCQKTHRSCMEHGGNSSSFMPTRLLEFDLDTNIESFKIVNSRDISATEPYMALSHRWGLDEMITLTSDSTETFYEGAPLDILTATFRDAIKVCQGFNCRYLWIDSLCILQDSAEDWTKESHMMKAVYGNAALTIAGGFSGKHDQGLFATRKSKAILVPQVESRWETLRNDRYCVVNVRTVLSGMDFAPLSRRAWVVQERFLSPRILFFGQHQMFYECCQLTACESFPAGKSRHELGWQPKKVYTRLGSPRLAWETAIKAYSGATLTRSTDKVIAFAGIAELSQRLLRDKYIVGLWRSRFLIELCWETSAHCSQRPDPCIAPTWSWLSIDDGVSPIQEEVRAVGRPLMEVQNINVDLVNPEYSTGNINFASLEVRCHLKPCRWSLKPGFGRTDFRRSAVSCEGVVSGEDDDRLSTYVDVLPSDGVLASQIYLLPVTHAKSENARQERMYTTPIGSGEGTLLALLVKQKYADQPNIFERVGRIDVEWARSQKILMQRRTKPVAGQGAGLFGGILQMLSLAEAEDPEWERLPFSNIVLL